MLITKAKVEAAIEEAVAGFAKKLHGEKWGKIAEDMKSIGSDTYNGAAVEKMFMKAKKNGLPSQEDLDSFEANLKIKDDDVKADEGNLDKKEIPKAEDDMPEMDLTFTTKLEDEDKAY